MPRGNAPSLQRRRAPGVHDTWAGAAPSIGRLTDLSTSGATRLTSRRGTAPGYGQVRVDVETINQAAVRVVIGEFDSMAVVPLDRSAGRPGRKMGSCAHCAAGPGPRILEARRLTGHGQPASPPRDGERLRT